MSLTLQTTLTLQDTDDLLTVLAEARTIGLDDYIDWLLDHRATLHAT